MSFADFKGIWQIRAKPAPTGETEGHWIVIGGTKDNVRIFCLDEPHRHSYGGFSYQESGTDGKLIRPDGFAITLQSSDVSNQITYCSEACLTPGSWTAEDNPGGTYASKSE